jgi:hypothetical protein
MLESPDCRVGGVTIERLMGARQLAAGDLSEQRDRGAAAQPPDRVLRGASGAELVKQDVEPDGSALRSVPEKFGEPVVKDAASAQTAGVGCRLGAAPPAEIVSGRAGALTTAGSS